jgi:nucleoside 2-deoxyribosyltransferase
MNDKLKVYLAGPIAGQTGEAVNSSIAEKSAILADFGYLVYHPMVGKEKLINSNDIHIAQGYDFNPIANNHAIFSRDKWMVMQADIVLADLAHAGGRVSIGTMMEIAWANLMGKQVIVIMPFGNIHDHLFVREAATIIFGDIEEAYDYLKELSIARLGGLL